MSKEFDSFMKLVDENDYPLLEGTINLSRSPIDILADYIKVRYETGQVFENLVNNLKSIEAKQLTKAYDKGYFDGLHEGASK